MRAPDLVEVARGESGQIFAVVQELLLRQQNRRDKGKPVNWVLEMAIQTLIKEFPEAREETEAFRGENKKRREARGKTTRKPRPTPSKVNTAESRSISIYELDNQSIDYIAFYGPKSLELRCGSKRSKPRYKLKETIPLNQSVDDVLLASQYQGSRRLQVLELIDYYLVDQRWVFCEPYDLWLAVAKREVKDASRLYSPPELRTQQARSLIGQVQSVAPGELYLFLRNPADPDGHSTQVPLNTYGPGIESWNEIIESFEETRMPFPEEGSVILEGIMSFNRWASRVL